ncbi:hypothetical protein SERLA73DRAFT_145525 [Serpula lacrymans var. lacrymans S7.3]|uniref:Uncharacterized protein n=2 Tax=Serpula lacrymans var. lacrymans TaxID=341189 RepID=F8QDY5_SERL3|nr:uncharacterized protein SERLADRAFT_403504 [Serpula lacrymans var. lacrymans S7.9]EGN93360.1 hypothetical protein SERLA73DRAFT_145525 [Serpula lacrymans var. lacrymans S7.3]EGO18741.1 hypothetical protein SERLADRAFT_403504 [Serpula lacrymans var. lacrymans S7.9]
MTAAERNAMLSVDMSSRSSLYIRSRGSSYYKLTVLIDTIPIPSVNSNVDQDHACPISYMLLLYSSHMLLMGCINVLDI